MKIPKISTLMNSIDLFKKINNLIDVARMPLERSTAYVVGDVVHVYALPSNLYLECIQAGTTSFYALNLTNVSVKDELTDGTVVWRVGDVKSGGGGGHEIVEEIPDPEDAEDNFVYFIQDENNTASDETRLAQVVTDLANDVNDLKVIETGADYVIASGHNSDNTQWYRRWKSGWLEQGGIYNTTNNRTINFKVNLTKNFATQDYIVSVSPISANRGGLDTWSFAIAIMNKLQNEMIIHSYGIGSSDVAIGLTWYACGQGGED